MPTESGVQAITDDGPLTLFAWKTSSDPFAGRVTYFRVGSGVLANDAQVYNHRSQGSEKFARISAAQGKTLNPVAALHAGDLGAVAKLKDTATGDSLGTKENEVLFPLVELPPPSISYAIQPKTRHDEDRLSSTISKVLEEDRSLNFYRDAQTQEFLLAGNGQQHLDIVCSKLRKRYNVDVELRAPKIPYRETIRGHSRCPRAPQEADRRPRTVWRLQDPGCAPGPGGGIRVRGRDLRRRDSQDVHSQRWRKGFWRRRPGASWPDTLSSISR